MEQKRGLLSPEVKVSFTNVTNYQLVRIGNARIRSDKALGIESSKAIIDELAFNKIEKKNRIKLNKDIKRFKANAKAGAKNKGWITRKQNELNQMNSLLRESYQKISQYNTPEYTMDDKGRVVKTHYFDKQDKTRNAVEVAEAGEMIREYIAGGTLDMLAGSPRLYTLVSRLIIQYFGTYNKFKKWDKENPETKY